MENETLRFAHLADLHLGAWREKKLTNLNFQAFQTAINNIIEENLDFVIFAGDIFNTAIPQIEIIDKTIKELVKLKEKNIPLYIIGGSHDYSNSGKSFLKILESAKLLEDVAKWKTIDKNEIELITTKNEKLKINLAGVLGKKNGLDKNIYKNLKENSLNKNFLNIFLFHTTLNDIKPDFLKNYKSEVTSNFLPKGFNYYAGGHVHAHIESTYDNAKLSYPGPLFPNNFSELKREIPSFNICEYNFSTKNLIIKRKIIENYEKIFIEIEIKGENPIDAKNKIEKEIEKHQIKNKIILLEIKGIVDGKISDININKIISNLYEKEALHILKNTYKLSSSKINTQTIENNENTNQIEEKIIKEKTKETTSPQNYEELMKKLLKLDLNKREEEKNAHYEQRIIEAIKNSIEN